jgi:phosphotransacetylase
LGLIGRRGKGSREDYISRSVIFTPHQIFIWAFKQRIRRAGHVYLRRRYANRILVGKHETDHLEDSVLKLIFKKWDGGMEWMDQAQDRDRWRTLVNAILNLRVPQNAGNFLTNETCQLLRKDSAPYIRHTD